MTVSEFDNDDIIFEKFHEDEVVFCEAVGPDADEEFCSSYLMAIKVAREMKKRKANIAYESMCQAIGNQLIEQVMKYGELVAVKEELHVINGRG